MEFLIHADNPKGLDFDYLHRDGIAAQNTVKKIHALGGINITVNGIPIPVALIEANS